ncbi:MAG: type I-MYXAN CRISPR-associated protein Cas6/Cmx6 [Gallionella sp.]
MTSQNIPEMIDMVFDLEGGILPASHTFALWDALLHIAPELDANRQVGVLQLRTSANGTNVFLAKRAKLTIRIPKAVAQQAAAKLTGRQLTLAGTPLNLGSSKMRELQAFPTLHAHLVTGNEDEVIFIEGIQQQLRGFGISANLICGKRSAISDGSSTIRGYSLVVHDLKPDASVLLQSAGLGTHRQFGCGIFIPYKVITGLSED